VIRMFFYNGNYMNLSFDIHICLVVGYLMGFFPLVEGGTSRGLIEETILIGQFGNGFCMS
jgi:hypothetical protein